MFRKILKFLCIGAAFGSLIGTIISLVFTAFNPTETMTISTSDYIKQCIAAMIVGVAWSVPSIVYESDKIAIRNKIFIQLGIGFFVYFPVALWAGWIPVKYGTGAIVTSVLIMIVSAIAIWFCFYFHYKKEAERMNERIKKMKE